MSETDLLHTMDARVWALEFYKRFGGDEQLMLTWFANALMCGYDDGKKHLRAAVDEMRELMACGHPKAYWVPDHFFSAMKPCDEPYDVYRCEIGRASCRERV